MASPDRQLSLTDPDARAMASAGTGTGTGLVGYNLQAAVDTESHIVVAHEVLNLGHDRTSLAAMSRQAAAATGTPALTVLADRGYSAGPEVLACEEAGIVAVCPKPLTSGAEVGGRFGKQDFVYRTGSDTYRRPAGETLTRRFTSVARHDAARLRDARVPLALPGQGPLARRHARPQANGGTRLRHAEGLDGPQPLQDKTARKRGSRGEPPHPRLQHQARRRPPRHPEADGSDASLNTRTRAPPPLPVKSRSHAASITTCSAAS